MTRTRQLILIPDFGLTTLDSDEHGLLWLRPGAAEVGLQRLVMAAGQKVHGIMEAPYAPLSARWLKEEYWSPLPWDWTADLDTAAATARPRLSKYLAAERDTYVLAHGAGAQLLARMIAHSGARLQLPANRLFLLDASTRVERLGRWQTANHPLRTALRACFGTGSISLFDALCANLKGVVAGDSQSPDDLPDHQVVAHTRGSILDDPAVVAHLHRGMGLPSVDTKSLSGPPGDLLHVDVVELQRSAAGLPPAPGNRVKRPLAIQIRRSGVFQTDFPVVAFWSSGTTPSETLSDLDALVDGAWAMAMAQSPPPGTAWAPAAAETSAEQHFWVLALPPPDQLGHARVRRILEDFLTSLRKRPAALPSSRARPMEDGSYAPVGLGVTVTVDGLTELLGVEDSVGLVIDAVISANRGPGDLESRISRLELHSSYRRQALSMARALWAPARLLRIDRPGDCEPIQVLRPVIGGLGARPAPPRLVAAQTRTRRVRIRADETYSFEFDEGTNRLRILEAPGARAEIDALVDRATKTSGAEHERMARLFELLIPPAMRSGLEQDLELVLDRPAANLPWEALMEAPREGAFAPGSEVSIVRRLHQDLAGTHRAIAKGRRALLICDPGVYGSNLPGALDEVVRLAALLRQEGFEVVECRRQTDEQTLALLQEDWGIVHISAHGHADQTGSWVQLDRHHLVADELLAGDTIPGLVFLNCCHSGHAPTRPAQDTLVAGLLAGGVPGVVTAGWPINDSAARTFARSFYGGLLEGKDFGHALLVARRVTRREHAHHDTWGAFHGYGEPDRRWFVREDLDDHPPLDPGEALDRVAGIMARAQLLTEARQAESRHALAEVAGQVDAEPRLQTAEVLATLADATRQLHPGDGGLRWYRRSLSTPVGRTPLDPFVDWATEVGRVARLAPDRLRPGEEREARRVLALLRQVVDSPQVHGATASALKTRLMIDFPTLDRPDLHRRVRELAEAYRPPEGRASAYLLQNHVVWRTAAEGCRAACEPELREIEGLIGKDSADRWATMQAIEARILRELLAPPGTRRSQPIQFPANLGHGNLDVQQAASLHWTFWLAVAEALHPESPDWIAHARELLAPITGSPAPKQPTPA